MHSSRMRTSRSSSHHGGSPHTPPGSRHLPPWEQTPTPLSRPPQVWAWRPPPRPDLSTSPLGVGLETTPQPDPSTTPWVWAWKPPPSQIPQLPPWVWAWKPARHLVGYHPPPPRPAARHAGIPPAMHAGIPPPCWQNDRHVWKDNLRKLRLRAVIMISDV